MIDDRSTPEPGDSPNPPPSPPPKHPVQLTRRPRRGRSGPRRDGVHGDAIANGRLVARSVLPPEAWGQIQEFGIFDEPVQIVLVARAAPPGSPVSALRDGAVARRRGRGEATSRGRQRPRARRTSRRWSGGRRGRGRDGERTVRGPHSARPHRPLRSRSGAPREPAARGGRTCCGEIIDGETSEVVDRALADLLGFSVGPERSHRPTPR